MSAIKETDRYQLPPPPPFLVRLDRYKQFWNYEIRRNWKSRTIAMIVFLTTLSLFWWTYAIKTPYLEQLKQHRVSPDIVKAKVAQLEAQLDDLDTTVSEEKLLTLERHIIQNYAGIAKLIETSIDEATHNKLILSYQLNTPTPANVIYFDDLAEMPIEIRLVPMPKTPEKQVWLHIIRQIYDMLEIEQKYQLSDIHISTSNQHIKQVVMHLSILIRLDETPQETIL